MYEIILDEERYMGHHAMNKPIEDINDIELPTAETIAHLRKAFYSDESNLMAAKEYASGFSRRNALNSASKSLFGAEPCILSFSSSDNF